MGHTAVFGFTILDGETLEGGLITPETKLLLGVRSKETNPVQPSVISSPTHRGPMSVLEEILDKRTIEKKEMDFPDYVKEVYFISPQESDFYLRAHDPSIYVTNYMLAGKLGLADALERNKTYPTSIIPASLIKGFVKHTAFSERPGEEVYVRGPFKIEDHGMLNMIVVLNGDLSNVPKKTPSYNPLLWTSVENFERAVDLIDSEPIVGKDRKLHWPICGLCMTSSYAALQNAQENNIRFK